MALSDKQILEEMKKGDIIIHPFKKENLATSSYDLTLGEWFYPQQKPSHFDFIYNIYNKEHVERVWGKKPMQAVKAREAFKNHKIDWVGISPDEKVIILGPGETILAHTNEFIGGLDHITTMMKARSSMGRSFIEVCKCAGWGDVGYVNRWTMEITNNSKYHTIPLVVGRRISQLVFFETGPILNPDMNYSTSGVAGSSGKYSSSTDVKKLEKTWTPDAMLPKLYKDIDIPARYRAK